MLNANSILKRSQFIGSFQNFVCLQAASSFHPTANTFLEALVQMLAFDLFPGSHAVSYTYLHISLNDFAKPVNSNTFMGFAPVQYAMLYQIIRQ
jgi:hypothetical protein